MVACNRPCKQRMRVKRRFYGDSDTPACNYLLFIACKMVSCNRPCKQRLRVKRRLHGDSDTPACNYLLSDFTKIAFYVPASHAAVTYLVYCIIVIQTRRATAEHGGPRRGTAGRRTRVLLHAMSRNAEDYTRCRASTIPYGCWCMGKKEGGVKQSRMGDRKEHQHSLSTKKNGH
jgi:hypothetical protein